MINYFIQFRCYSKLFPCVSDCFLFPVTPTPTRFTLKQCTSHIHSKFHDMSNNKVLNVAEKNDVAKGIAGILSNGHYDRRASFSRYNQIYEFDLTLHLFGNSVLRMIVTSVSGHLLNYEFAGDGNRNWETTPIGTLFEKPVQKICTQNGQPIKRTLENEAKKVGHLIIWTDCDREGENIGFEIIDICRKANRFITVHRAHFSEITRPAINRAIRNLAEPNQLISDAVDCRQELDLRIGAAFTRFQTLLARREFPDKLRDMLISYGSCQFPTLGFVVERYKQNESFVAEPFWKIVVEHRKQRPNGDNAVGAHEERLGDRESVQDVMPNNEIKVEFNWQRVRLFDKQACEILHLICTESSTALVENVVKKPKTKRRPVALETISLEKVASKKLRISARRTMDIAQRLYTKGFISYPRTETNIFPQNFNLTNLVQLQIPDHRWGDFAQRILNSGGPRPHNGSKTDEAHPPIHPIKLATALDLQDDERQVYEYIVRHFLACISEDAKGHETLVHIDVAGEKFTASGLIILERNYLDVYPYERWSDKELPDYTVGERFRPSDIRMCEGSTNAPPLLTEADLIALMERHGIGTDATHAEHIEKIKDRRYVALNQSDRFVPGFLGLGLVEGYDAMGYAMSKPNLRSELERGLVQIIEGTRRKEDVLREQVAKYKTTFERAYEQSRRLIDALAVYFGHHARNAPARRVNPGLGHGRPGGSDDDDDRGDGPPPGGFGPDAAALARFNDRIGDPPGRSNFSCDRGSRDFDCQQRNTNRPANRNIDFNANRPFDQNANDNDFGLEANSRSGFETNSRSCLETNSRSGFETDSRSGLETNWRNRTGSASDSFYSRDSGLPTLDNRFLCHCGEPPIELTVKKAGPNCGRKFFKCPKDRDSSCKFFAWSTSKPTDQGQDWRMANQKEPVFQKPTNWKKKGAWRDNAAIPSNNDEFFPVSVKWSGGMGRGGGSQSKGRSGEIGRKKFKSFQNNNDSGTKPLAGGYSINNVSLARGSARKCSVCRQAGHFANRCPTKL